MSGRAMPVECEHGQTLDWGGHADDWSPYRGLCPTCMPQATVDRLTAEYRTNNRHWLEEYHQAYYRLLDLQADEP